MERGFWRGLIAGIVLCSIILLGIACGGSGAPSPPVDPLPGTYAGTYDRFLNNVLMASGTISGTIDNDHNLNFALVENSNPNGSFVGTVSNGIFVGTYNSFTCTGPVENAAGQPNRLDGRFDWGDNGNHKVAVVMFRQ